MTRNYRPADLEPQIPAIYRRGEKLPPGGGACHWCSRRLYRSGKRWNWAQVEEDGYMRAVHLRQCYGPDAGNRPWCDIELREASDAEVAM